MGIYDQLEKLNQPAVQSLPATSATGPAPSPLPEKSTAPQGTQSSTSKPTRVRDIPREKSSDGSREKASERSRESLREIPRHLPTRDEVQEFSFQLRDELKVKVQAEVPHGWQEELETMARDLNVKKLELYRFILGEFLGKVRRKKASSP